MALLPGGQTAGTTRRWVRGVDIRDVIANDQPEAHYFLRACIMILEREASVDHPMGQRVYKVMRDALGTGERWVAARHAEGFRRVAELRAWKRVIQTSGELVAALRRRLAVLSACESILTDARLPNEAIGLPSVLLHGFAGVIASSWKVDDLATAYLMTAFYHQWCEEGQEPAVALNLAQRWLRLRLHGGVDTGAGARRSIAGGRPGRAVTPASPASLCRCRRPPGHAPVPPGRAIPLCKRREG